MRNFAALWNQSYQLLILDLLIEDARSAFEWNAQKW